jgi:hypothetical protein
MPQPDLSGEADPLNANEIEFVNLIIEQLNEHRIVDAALPRGRASANLTISRNANAPGV